MKVGDKVKVNWGTVLPDFKKDWPEIEGAVGIIVSFDSELPFPYEVEFDENDDIEGTLSFQEIELSDY